MCVLSSESLKAGLKYQKDSWRDLCPKGYVWLVQLVVEKPKLLVDALRKIMHICFKVYDLTPRQVSWTLYNGIQTYAIDLSKFCLKTTLNSRGRMSYWINGLKGPMQSLCEHVEI